MTLQMLKFFEIYTGVTLHFAGGSYDFFKYEGRTNVTEKSFLKRKDKYFFERWKDKCPDEQTAWGLCVANNVVGAKYIRNYTIDNYKKWLSYNEALNYKFEQEFGTYLTATQQARPKGDLLIDMVMSGELSKEFLILFNMIMNGEVYKQLDKLDSFVWEDLKTQLSLYEPFLKYLWNLDNVRLTELLHKSAIAYMKKPVDKTAELWYTKYTIEIMNIVDKFKYNVK